MMNQGEQMINMQLHWNTNKNLNTIQAIKLTKDIHVLAYMSNFCLFTNYSKNLT